MLAAADAPPAVADQFEAHVIWMSEAEMLPGRPYLMKIGTSTVGLTIAQPKYKIDVNTLDHAAAKTLRLNEIGVCNINFDRPVPFDPYVENRDMGGFIVIDRLTNSTVGAGLLHFALRRADNVHWQVIEVNKEAHARVKGQLPAVRLVHRSEWRRQVDHCQCGRAKAPRAGTSTPTFSTATTCATG